MTGKRIALAMTGLALALGGCESTGPRTQVVRTHLGQPIARGQITVEPLAPAMRGTPEFETYAGIVAAQLTRLGFNEVPNLASSEQVAVVGVEYTHHLAPPRGGLTIGLGVGGGSYGYHGGGGGGVGAAIPVSGGRGKEYADTRMLVQIKRRSDGTTIWQGEAQTSAPASDVASAPATAVQRLATALFADFPGVSGRTVVVK